ncbi:chloride channel protein [Streptomyces laculatispora]|uniref:Chloride channel protein n=1 Tax=Streptomyces laculatispora TaxID=887464 RepID=A0ABY9I0H2_9ACTN|nr:chloride channel protein [Streptomyces laculatispora]WLQ39151.1 chloride channel protein [Streptomyces laculatispora]
MEQQASEPTETRELSQVLRDSGYRKLLVLATLLGVPLSLLAFGFLTLEHAAQNGLWEHLPHQLGYADPPWWWPLPLLAVAGPAVAWVVTRLPGNGGHIPAQGMVAGPPAPLAVPGIIVAGLASLALGAVLGPEAPLTAMGAGLALMTVRSARRADSPQLVAVLAATGSAAAVATVFGSPIVAAVLIIELAGLGGPSLFALILPCLLAAGVGALVFTGFGSLTGLDTGGLALPSVPPSETPGVGDFLWGVPLAAVIACVVVAAMMFGSKLADWVMRRTAMRIVLCAVVVGVLLASYGLVTGRSPGEAALSGQATLAELAADPHAWPVSVLIWLFLFKGLAWAVSLAALRGGAVFPALLLGSALATACSGFPGFGVTSGLAVGLAAATAAVMRLPVTGTILAVLLLGTEAPGQVALIIVSSVVSFIVGELVRSGWSAAASESAEPPTHPAPATT